MCLTLSSVLTLIVVESDPQMKFLTENFNFLEKIVIQLIQF